MNRGFGGEVKGKLLGEQLHRNFVHGCVVGLFSPITVRHHEARVRKNVNSQPFSILDEILGFVKHGRDPSVQIRLVHVVTVLDFFFYDSLDQLVASAWHT